MQDLTTVPTPLAGTPCGASPQADGAEQFPARRSVVALAAVALGTAGAATLAACGSSSSAGSATASAGSGGAGALATLASVPVGGAVAARGSDGKPIVIAQPAAGKVRAFSAICTHQGCQVMVAGAQLNCPCHGSQFDALTGAVKQGPAMDPLPAVSVKISGTDVVAG